MTSIRIRPALAIGVSLFALAAASLLDVARIQPQQVAAARGDRQSVAALATDCRGNWLIAACANGAQETTKAMPPITFVQVFDAPGETTMVKVQAN